MVKVRIGPVTAVVGKRAYLHKMSVSQFNAPKSHEKVSVCSQTD